MSKTTIVRHWNNFDPKFKEEKTVKKRILALVLALVLAVSCFPTTALAVDYTLPSLWEEYEDYWMMGTFGNWNNQQQLYHYKSNSPSNALKLDSQIGNNNTNSLSRQAYVKAVEEINANTALSEEEKAAAIEEANRNVVLVERPSVMNTLDQVRAYNATVPEREQKHVRAHVLVWHGGQQPMYFFMNGFYYDKENPDWASPETMLARLENYIQQMMEKYAPYNDVIYSWDVVNEALDDYTGQVRNMDDPLKQNGQWGKIFRRPDLDDDPDARLEAESIYIRKAFEFARKYSNMYGADWTLYFNDFQDSNKPYEPKMSQTIKMLKPIYEAGNIDGYGMQGRLSSVYPSIDTLRKQIEMGLTVADEFGFTEADIRSDFMLNPDYDPSKPSTPNGNTAETNTYDVDNAPAIRKEGWGQLNVDGWNRDKANEMAMREDIQKEQADYAADLMDLLIEYKDQMSFLQWDGTNDRSTFNSSKGAHLWSGLTGNVEKMSFFAVIGAPNRDKMRQAIANAPEDYREGLYTAETWAAYQEAKAAAEALVDVRIYDIDGVNAVKDATKALNEAVEALEFTPSAISLTTDAHNVKVDEHFVLDATFNEVTGTNAAVLTYNFDGKLFDFANFTPAEGVTVVDRQYGEGFAKITVMAPDYETKELGSIMLHAKADAALVKEEQDVVLNAEYVVKNGDDKTIETATAVAAFTTLGNGSGEPAIPGDTDDNGELDLIDLSNMIDWFGTTDEDADWDEIYTFFDFNDNGEIDIYDISYVARAL